ncbi:transcriptional regulator [Prauserella marina]|uniref:DNA-binding transcriptional regulator, ArsR family n=1 Tax=Prauserella marina TaxID=530584 RepID=A0A222VIJ5_9PSEU|nr:metalloregulator ArsR/SmtB family transcription factor [Prauserella marina]ASR33756.1 transcriptional regulator [Prauserella marina]PWV82329.1 ArsR family transcriptional regulator [Prauserella marina]SDC66539.1 DNA-binding transcriptional regulator, ArsR family [Prauserella marina]
MTTSPEHSSVDAVLGALADPTRRALLDALVARGEASASALAADLPVSRQAIVKHLGLLGEAGLVSSDRVGREVRYRPRSDTLDATAHWMSALASEWENRLAAIKRAAEKD